MALAVLGTAGLIWFVMTRGDVKPPTSTAASTTVVQSATTAPATTSTELGTTTTTAIADATTTVAQPVAPVFTPPTIPATPVFTGPGANYTVADPLPSGLTFAEVQPALLVSQLMANLLAAHQWESARLSLYFFDGTTKTPTVEALKAQWGASTRLSLVLLDAHKDPNGPGYELLLGTIANLQDGSTSVLCNHLYADSTAPAVEDLGNATVISQDEPLFMPEEFLNDPTRIAGLQSQCIWQ